MPVAIPLAIAGASVAGAAISSRASSSAARTQAASTDAAAALQNQQFQQLLALQMPGYNRANAAGDLYSQALGIGSIGGGQQAPQGQSGQSYQTQPRMTGGGYGGGNVAQFRRGDMAVSPQQRLMTQDGDYGIPQSYSGGQAAGPQTQPPAAGGQPAPAQGGGQLDIASQVMNTPGYQTQMDQGMKSIDRAAPLVGGMYSGRRMKALNDYGQQTFGGYYNDWMNRVGGVAGQAQQISQSIGQAGQQNASNVGNLMMAGANARAQGSLNSAGAWNGAINQGLGMFGASQGWM